MAKLYRTLRRPVETAAFRLALVVVPRLPRRAVLALARTGAVLGLCFDRRGRTIGRANLAVAFGNTKTTSEQKRILRASYATLARTFLDIIWFGHNTRKRLERFVELDRSAEPLLCKKNQICITAHYGNWELLGLVMAMKGFPLHSIAMPVKNSAVNRMLIQRRQINGQQIIPREGALRKLLSVLRHDGKAAFLVDQNTGEKEGGTWADYFGLPVPVTPAPAALAAKTGSELFIGFCRPLPGGRYRVYATDAFTPPTDSTGEAVQQLTQQILTAIEREVRAHPEHWLWTYKRWKTIRPGDSREHYPSYSET
jgi:Kdo2-lipid IVA lauroyltransferase/acyltransferase